jgi:haloalkane dehalogenase
VGVRVIRAGNRRGDPAIAGGGKVAAMEFIETPASRFHDLLDYPFAPHHVRVDERGLDMHYVDEGPREAAPILLLHGEPTWSYLYRHMIPPCAAAGHRVIAPDLIGFGKSSKPTRIRDYSYLAHCQWLRALIEAQDLRGITLFCQDWGSLIGLRLAAEMPERFARIVVGNGFLPEARKPQLRDLKANAAFLIWRTFATTTPYLPIARIVQSGTRRRLDPEELRAYDAPFPDRRYKAGARAFPALVPLWPSDPAAAANQRAWRVLERWTKPFLTVFSTGDPITRGLERKLQARIPGAAGQPHHKVRGGHFLQEDASAELCAAILGAIARG